MPTSNPDAVTFVSQVILSMNPASVLDVGIGFGKYGFLAREYTDICRERYHNWTTRIDGIEIWEKYITDLQRMVYTNIYIGDAVEVIKDLPVYDLLICSDMLEHLSKERGQEFMRLAMEHSKHSIVLLPSRPSNQKAVNGNPHEAHIATWTQEELAPYGAVSLFNAIVLLVRR